ncbi:L,D-transpeptidase family protein [Massilistercora timonensis]|uniref:L,D-transpeptidase family protein n=1 Tax=Massilistercora timonensis TaxID=2086584 RepID=UPI003209EF68
MGNTDKNTDKNADEIIQETMKEIYEDLDKEKAFEKEEETEEDFLDEEDTETDEEDFLDEEDTETDEEDFLDEEDFPGAVETDLESENEEAEEESQEEEAPEIPDEEDDEEEEETEAEKAYRKHKFRKKLAIVLGSIFGVLAVVYLGFAFFFSSHFMFFTTINGTDVTLKSVSQVEEYMRQQVADYTLTLEESDGDTEEISGSDISLEYVPGDELEKLVKGQKNFLWLKALWDHPELEAKVGVKYDEDALARQIEGLACMDPENQVKSVNAHPEFKETQFEIVPEVVGTQINTEVFNEAIRTSIDGFQHTMDLSETGSYIQPAFVEDSPEVIEANKEMNEYLKAKITYDFDPETEVVDASVISQWVKVNDKMEVTFDKKAVKKYIGELADKYDTKGKSRKFTTATGNTVTVEGGAYGWKINQDEEYKALTENIKKGETVTREPKYSSRAASHGAIDIGNTYAEVDLTNQRAYFIKNGKVVLDSPVVTGNPNKGNATPQGTDSLTYKTRNAVLRGDRLPDGSYSYESPVKYWMPFNGGIGFHDASWQSAFGGTRYKTHGSHGCINMPTDQAAKMYELISDGTPVVVHY